MSITVEEKYDSRQSTTGDNAQVTLTYIASGSDDDLAIKSAVENFAPETYDSLPRQSVQIEPISEEYWDASVRYAETTSTTSGGSSAPDPGSGEYTYSFDTMGGTQHITQSLDTVGSYADSSIPSAPDFHGAIGVSNTNGNAEVQGVDITVPIYNFSETHYLTTEQVTPEYKGTLFQLTGKVNNATFRGLAAGECLFLGASGTLHGTETDTETTGDWEITYRFAASPNKTGITIGSITGIAKKGWEYLWVRYADVEDMDAMAMVKRPVAAYVEQVYEDGDFSSLNIGS
tara:strand:- start:32 stop:895 length:864 start_codon:yes stop_codon:yes gene_type:complete